jgi:hypothetical protein
MIVQIAEFHRKGNYYGISSVEKIMVDTLNRPQRNFSNGKYDTLATKTFFVYGYM